MTTLSAAQIAALVSSAGWPSGERATAVAIALAESGGRTDARGDTALQTATWGPSIGLFQIRSVKAEYGKGTTRDERANLDPATNVRHALSIRNSQGLSAWSVYTSQAYRLHMPAAQSAVGSAGGGGGSVVGDLGAAALALGDPLGILTGPAAAASQAAAASRTALGYVDAVTKWITDPHNWERVAKVVVGGVLLVAGLGIVARPAVEPLAGVLPVGRAAKLATSLAKGK